MANSVIGVKRGDTIERNMFLRKLVDALYIRNDIDLVRGTFRVKGDTVDIAMAYSDNILRITWWDDDRLDRRARQRDVPSLGFFRGISDLSCQSLCHFQ